MSELLPCPFCGGRQTYRKHDGGVWLTTTNHKRGCIMRDALAFVAFNTEAEAVEAWNTRAELTCEIEVRDSAWGGFTRHCGNCGADLDCDTRNKQNYCPNCGARVMKSDQDLLQEVGE